MARFKDGEVRPEIKKVISGKDVFFVQNTYNPIDTKSTNTNLIELLLTADVIRRCDPANLTLIQPYLSYSKQERTQGGQSNSTSTILSCIKESGVKRLITMELHALATEGFTRPENMLIEGLYTSAVILDLLPKILTDKNDVLLAPDAGAAKRVNYLRTCTGYKIDHLEKYRKPDSCHESIREEEKLDVEGKSVAIIDDQIAGGGTLVSGAKLAKKAGATKVYGIATHGLLFGNAEEDIRRAHQDGHLDMTYITNTIIHPREFFQRNQHITELDITGILAHAIFQIHTDGDIKKVYSPILRKALCGDGYD